MWSNNMTYLILSFSSNDMQITHVNDWLVLYRYHMYNTMSYDICVWWNSCLIRQHLANDCSKKALLNVCFTYPLLKFTHLLQFLAFTLQNNALLLPHLMKMFWFGSSIMSLFPIVDEVMFINLSEHILFCIWWYCVPSL